MAARLFILGATGDLTSRYLIPAVAGMRHHGLYSLSGPIVGVDRKDWDTPTFRRHVAENLEKNAKQVPAEYRQATVDHLEYRQADVTDAEQLAAVIGDSPEPAAIYMALPPDVAGEVLKVLAHVKLPEGSRIVVEKPFGRDLASAKALNDLIRPSFPESSVFRIDHFLGKQTAQNLLGLRFANRVFEFLWNREHVERVEIVWDESVALEGRAGYYDRAGALRDMVQNHLLQLLCFVAMEAPVTFGERDFRDRKADVLRAVRRFSPDEVARHTQRARYSAGTVNGQAVPDYADEPGVDPSRQTETFARVELFIDNWRWAGVPFVLRTGKAMAEPRAEIVVHFRPVPYMPFGKETPTPNVLRLRLSPDRMSLGVNINGAGDPFDLERVDLGVELAPHELSAYARLMLDILDGNPILSIRGDEAEESWKIVEPILEGWANGLSPLQTYPAGSTGPESP